MLLDIGTPDIDIVSPKESSRCLPLEGFHQAADIRPYDNLSADQPWHLFTCLRVRRQAIAKASFLIASIVDGTLLTRALQFGSFWDSNMSEWHRR